MTDWKTQTTMSSDAGHGFFGPEVAAKVREALVHALERLRHDVGRNCIRAVENAGNCTCDHRVVSEALRLLELDKKKPRASKGPGEGGRVAEEARET